MSPAKGWAAQGFAHSAAWRSLMNAEPDRVLKLHAQSAALCQSLNILNEHHNLHRQVRMSTSENVSVRNLKS